MIPMYNGVAGHRRHGGRRGLRQVHVCGDIRGLGGPRKDAQAGRRAAGPSGKVIGLLALHAPVPSPWQHVKTVLLQCLDGSFPQGDHLLGIIVEAFTNIRSMWLHLSFFIHSRLNYVFPAPVKDRKHGAGTGGVRRDHQEGGRRRAVAGARPEEGAGRHEGGVRGHARHDPQGKRRTASQAPSDSLLLTPP